MTELILQTGYFHTYMVLILIFIGFIAGIYAEKLRIKRLSIN